MNLPFFYAETIVSNHELIVLDEDASRHCALVLRMKPGEKIRLTNGKGNLLITEVVSVHKKSTQVRVQSSSYHPKPSSNISIGISLLKNSNRFEWFSEKATEIGVDEIFPLLCERTEKQNFRFERINNILVSAMLQSQQVWLPLLHEPVTFEGCLDRLNFPQKFIAHCLEDSKKRTLKDIYLKDIGALVFIGPEGDFSKKEIEMAMENKFIPVALGETRLRTETAGIVAITVLKNI